MEVVDQEHLLSCSELDEEGTLVGPSHNYQDLFGSNIEKQVNVARILERNISTEESFEMNNTTCKKWSK